MNLTDYFDFYLINYIDIKYRYLGNSANLLRAF